MTEEVGLLQRMATRLSLRKVKKEQGMKPEKVDVKDEEEKEEEMKEESDVENGEQESVLHNDTKVGGKEPANELPTNGGKVTEKGKKKKARDAKKEGDDEKESGDDRNDEEGVMQRLKSRLSMRGKKKDKVTNTSDQQKECNGTNEDTKKEEKAENKKEVEEEPEVEEKRWVSGSKEKDANKVEQEEEEKEGKETEKEEKKKSDNAFLRMLRKLSFRKKKKKGNTENDSGVEEGDKGGKESEKTLDEANTSNKLVEKRFEERETRPQSLVMSSGRPPPGPGRPPIHPRTTTTPSSATANVSRPVSDLDSALRQFKLSTAESRESLRTLGSRQDLTQVEERVREAVGKSLSRQGSLRRGASGSTSIPITLSVSLQELRANQ